MKADKYIKNLTCLYVEDDDFIRESFSMLLGRYFKEVIIAENGEIGLQKFKENRVDFIISDIRMPVMDGIEMVSKIREINSEVIIFFVTAFNDIDYLQKAIELNVDAYLTKPLDKRKLVEKLNKFAKLLKIKEEESIYQIIIDGIFNKIKLPMCVVKNNDILFSNKAFKYYFDELDVNNLDDRLEINKNDVKLIFEIEKENLFENVYFLVFKDITKYEEEIFIDALTQVYNRKIIESILPKIFNKKVCLIMLDIDNFKKINDTYGHNKGDEVLKTLGEILKKSLRKNDLIIRWGGEEFIVILDDVDDINTEKFKAEIIRKAIEDTEIDEVGHFSASFGVCCDKVSEYDELIKLIEKADEALYRAKRNGKNRVEVCN